MKTFAVAFWFDHGHEEVRTETEVLESHAHAETLARSLAKHFRHVELITYGEESVEYEIFAR